MWGKRCKKVAEEDGMNLLSAPARFLFGILLDSDRDSIFIWNVGRSLNYPALQFRSSKLLYNLQSVSQYVLVSSTLVGLATRYYFLSVCFCLKFAVLYLWGTLSGERTGLQFAVQSVNSPSRAEHVTILYCLIWDSANLEGQVPIFISSRIRVAQLYPHALGSLYVASCDSGLWWRYSNPPPTCRPRPSYIFPSGQDGPVQSQSHVTTDGQSISMSWCLVHCTLNTYGQENLKSNK
jgi:hypothetical protein